MNKFQPGGLRNRRDDIGGRPRGDVNAYAPKNRAGGGKPAFQGGFGNKRPGGFNPKDRAPRPQQSYDAICTSCGAKCDVPFRPDGTKPVLCRDCFSKKNSSATNMSGNRDRFTSNERVGHKPDRDYGAKQAPQGVSAEQYNLLVQQLSALEAKVTQILTLVQASETLVTNLPSLEVEAVTPKPKKATKKVATPATKKVAVKKEATKKVAAKKTVAKAASKKRASK